MVGRCNYISCGTMDKLVVITHPHFLPHEARLIVAALDAGAHYMHLRKPCADRSLVEPLLEEIPRQYHPRIVLNDCHELALHYDVCALHLNARHPVAPAWWSGAVTASCHTMAEVAERKEYCKYVLLSPIYDSISKQGYREAFTHDALITATRQGVIDDKVVALGGVTPYNISLLQQYGFGGAAVLGSVWNNSDADSVKSIVEKLKNNMLCYNL